ncbi:LSm family protein [Paenibacillus sp. SC116]|uniref:LSm family protein n=1 Tax=Paenibacillus sp. SC116 TaxID=2968986 RepID=UPI00215B0F7E|nr:LSm family protein [Paenibacillus sp. SC116]MCR8845373.1 LSm family protein [Paenibacillus sp. SC116]
MPCSCQQPKPGILYQGDPNVLGKWKTYRDSMQEVLQPHLHRTVRITLDNGNMYEGTIVGVDGSFLLLEVMMPTAVAQAAQSGAEGYAASHEHRNYRNVILPLVLYELLVITLLL